MDIASLAVTVSTGSAVVTLWTHVVWRIIRRAVHLSDLLEEIEARTKELTPNGGGSLKDDVNKIVKVLDDKETP